MAMDLVNVGNFRFVPEAETARLRLRDEGIQAFLSNAELVNMDWLYGNATGWVKILVPDDQADAAHAVLAAMRDERDARRHDRAAPLDHATCLACGERLPANGSTCSACGWSYGAEADATDGDNDDEGGKTASESTLFPRAMSPEAPVEPLDDATEKAETDATNFRLLVGLLVFGVIATGLLPRLRELVQRMLP